MTKEMSTFKKYLILLILGASAGAIYILPYIKYTFYAETMQVMNITDAQSGFLLSMYAIGCIVLYIPGGILADKIQPKWAIAVSLFITTMFTFVFAFTFDYATACVIWFFLAFCSCFVFWAAILKAVRVIGKPEEQGSMYGIYYAANGGASAIISTLCLNTYSATNGGDVTHGMFMACMVMAAFTALCTILVLIFVPSQTKEEIAAKGEDEKFKISDLGKVFSNKYIWILSAMFFCIYGVYSCSTYFTPYVTDILGYSSEESSLMNIVRVYGAMFAVPPIAGYLADKVFKSTTKWFVVCGSMLTVVVVSIIVLGSMGVSAGFISLLTIVVGFFAMGLYGIMFSTMNEARIPVEVTGTAIGIASIVGYLPDLVMHTFFGNLIGNYGETGYLYIFWILAAMSIIPAIGAAYIYKTKVKD